MDWKEMNNLRKLRSTSKELSPTLIKEVLDKIEIVYKEAVERQVKIDEAKRIEAELLEKQKQAILESGVNVSKLIEALADDKPKKKRLVPKKANEDEAEKPENNPETLIQKPVNSFYPHN